MVVGITTTYAISTYHHYSRYRSFWMITVLIWKKACINLFITYFNIELKRTKLASHTHTHQTMSDWYRLRNDNSPNMEKGMHCSIYIEACYYVVPFIKRLGIMLSEFCPDICPLADIDVALRYLRMGKIDVITYKYVIRFVIDLRQVGGFPRFVPPIKLTATI